MDFIKIEQLEIYAYHGVFEEEQKNGQKFYVDATLFCSTQRAAINDSIEHTIHYGEVCHTIQQLFLKEKCHLIETVANRCAKELLLKFEGIEKLDLQIYKPNAPIGLPFGNVSVRITRGWERVFIGIGSNLGDSGSIFEYAINLLKNHEEIRFISKSDYIQTKPYGVLDQPDFLNGVLELETVLSPIQLLEYLKAIEAKAGRIKGPRWGPRCLDLDILFYGECIVREKNLTIPHADLNNRRFVLEPLFQLEPYLKHPITGETVKQMLEQLPY